MTDVAPEEEPEYSVHVEDPRYAEGELIDIPGLGSVPNYGDKALEPYQVELFKEQGYTWPEDNDLQIIKDEGGNVLVDDAAEAAVEVADAEAAAPYEEMHVDELKVELESRELPTSGTKPELVDRLVADDKEAQ